MVIETLKITHQIHRKCLLICFFYNLSRGNKQARAPNEKAKRSGSIHSIINLFGVNEIELQANLKSWSLSSLAASSNFLRMRSFWTLFCLRDEMLNFSDCENDVDSVWQHKYVHMCSKCDKIPNSTSQIHCVRLQQTKNKKLNWYWWGETRFRESIERHKDEFKQ